jgi:hypothetical protein
MSCAFSRWFLPVLFALVARPAAHADTVTLSPVADTTLFEHDPNNNLGADPTVAAGTTAGVNGPAARSRALLKFDVAASIPTNATITSASLTIKVTKTPSPSRVDSIFDLRRVLQSWNEGKKSGDTGSTAAAGETTWRARSHSSTPANAILWTSPGGGTNTDFSAVVSASTMVRGLGSYTFASAPELVADVQAWLQDTNANQGWIVISQLERTPRTARRIGARERPAGDRPRLAVEFTIPTTTNPPQLHSAQRSGDTFNFAFAAEANSAYAVEFADTLPTVTWQALTNIAAAAAARQITVSDGSVTNTPQRIYRVRTQ